MFKTNHFTDPNTAYIYKKKNRGKYNLTCLEWGELLISRRALAPLSRDSASKPPPRGSSAAGDDLPSESVCDCWGEEEEEKGEKRNGDSAWARLESAGCDAATAAAAAAAKEDNLEAVIDDVRCSIFCL